MLAARLYGPGKLVVEEIKKPKINDNEVLVKIINAALCGTDIRMYQNGYPGVDEKNPRVLGHEFVGVIDQVGKNVEYYKEGMDIALAPNIGCGICDRCISGSGHLCDSYTAFGIKMDGAFAEFVKVPERAIKLGNLIEIPKGIKAEDVSLNEPLSCAYNGALQCCITPGDYVLIVGAGAIGILHAKLAKMFGAAKVIMSDLSVERLNLCKQIEAGIITYHGEEIRNFIMDLTNGRGVDVCITACPSAEVQKNSLELMAYGGRVNFFGGLPEDKQIVPLNTNAIHYKQLIVTGTTRASISHFRKTLSLIQEGLIDLTGIVTGRFNIKDTEKALEYAQNAVGIKNIIEF